MVAGGSLPHYSDRSRRIAASFLKRHCASESGTEPVAQRGLQFLERGPGCGPAHSPQPCVPGGDTESPGGGADRPGDDAEPRHVCSSTRPGAAAAARDVFPRVTHAAGRLQTPRPLHPARPRRRVREERRATVSHSQPRASAGLLATSPRGSSPAASLLRPQGPCTPATQHGRSPGARARVRWPGAPVLHGASVHCSGRAVRISPAILPGGTCPPSGPRARPPGPSSSQGQPHNAAGPSGSPDPGSRGRSPATQGPELDCSAGLAVREDRRVPCREGGRGSRADCRAEDGGGKQGHVAGAPTSGA